MAVNAERVLRIVNYDRYQHYRDRRPPWVKLYVEFLDDYDLTRLPPASRLLAACSMLLAARCDDGADGQHRGCIPHDVAWIAGCAHLPVEDVENGISDLLRAGFYAAEDGSDGPGKTASAPMAPSYPPKTEVEAETENGPIEVPPLGHLERVAQVLALLHRVDKPGFKRLTAEAVERAIADTPGLDHVHEAGLLAEWHLSGKGRSRQVRDGAKAYRNWLAKAKPIGVTHASYAPAEAPVAPVYPELQEDI